MVELVPLKDLVENKMGRLLSFPRFDRKVVSERLQELAKLGVTTLVNGGPLRLGDVSVLGRGHAGVVVEAHCEIGHVALKIRRVDASRDSMSVEASLLKGANAVEVGPQLYGWSQNFLLMELFDGPMIVDWLDSLKPENSESVRHLLKDLILATRRLDESGIDHGELSKAYKHIIVSDKGPKIIDFESASTVRRCANVTSIVQFLFFNSVLSSRLSNFMVLPDKDALLKALGAYKGSLSQVDFDGVLLVCGLQ